MTIQSYDTEKGDTQLILKASAVAVSQGPHSWDLDTWELLCMYGSCSVA